MIAFFRRHIGYKLGMVYFFVATILFYVGNYTPQWVHYSKIEFNVTVDHSLIRYREINVISSVLLGCKEEKENGTFYSESRSCGIGYHVESATGGWLPLCQAFEVLGVLGLLLACIYTIRVNFFKAELGPIRRYVEAAALASGSLGFLGSTIFVGEISGRVRDSELYVFGWSLFFTIFVSILIVIAGVIIFIFNNRPADVPRPYERIQ